MWEALETSGLNNTDETTTNQNVWWFGGIELHSDSAAWWIANISKRTLVVAWLGNIMYQTSFAKPTKTSDESNGMMFPEFWEWTVLLCISYIPLDR